MKKKKKAEVLFGWCAARQCHGTATARPCPGVNDSARCTCVCHIRAQRELEALL